MAAGSAPTSPRYPKRSIMTVPPRSLQNIPELVSLPPLHALPGAVVVPPEDQLLLQELPQGLQGRGAGVER